ncbi:hypothetical protein A1O7_02852 [Cladophialophora yegresii CBS 114405]|uniref:Uncharacterized protein n=1 Tax=Cladophialophora yegresii CBS 114405 TaxID=1182544 RepID=W9W2Y2_9EURO|nr:uncharacterized protein A1O7_02852 [Cladophialophora yegresii CBS 114405]EXJ62417.1 hypothetical protein A1O7_02852 [Cladophialophora yegresii CBS 114405]
MPKKPASASPSTSFLPPESSLAKRPKYPRPPVAVPGLPSAKKLRVTKVASPNLSLPNSPIQARRNAEEEVVRQEKEEIERMRQAWMQKLHEAEKIADHVEAFLEQEEAELKRSREEEATRRQAWTRKLRKAEQIANLIESFGWDDKTSIDRYLRLRSLVERGKELERCLEDSYKKSGLNPRTREVANAAWHSLVDAFADPNLAWIQPRLDESRRGRRRSLSVREGKPRPSLPSRVRFSLFGIMTLQDDMVDTATMIGVHLHELRQLRRTRLQLFWVPELHSYHKFTLPLEYLADAASLTATRIRDNYIQFRKGAKLLHRPSSRRLAKILVDEPILHHVGKVHWLSRVIVRDIRHELSQISASVLQRELFSTYQPLATYNAYSPVLKNYIDFAGRDRSPGKLHSLSARHLKLQRDILLQRDFTWLWAGISKASSLDRCWSNDYHASMDQAHTGSPASPITRLLVPSAQVDAGRTAPWATPTPLYPLGPAVPILYVTTFSGLTSVLHRFSSPERCKHLAFDIVQTPGTKCYPGVQFLTLASEHEVAVIQFAAISYFSILQAETFEDVMKNPSILKVGVDVESQQRLLADGPGIEVEGLVELHTSEHHDIPLKHLSPNNGRSRRVSSMAARSLGFSLPPLDLDQAVNDIISFKSVGRTRAVDPLPFLTHIASRAYAILQIYLASTTGGSFTSAPAAHPLLGPVEVYGQAGKPERYSELRSSRMKYLKCMARFLVSRTAFRAQLDSPATNLSSRLQLKKRLMAYFLFTTFNERLETVEEILGMSQVASNILAIVDAAKLPLRTQDAGLLERHRKIYHEDMPIRKVQYTPDIPLRARTSMAPTTASQKAEPMTAPVAQVAWKSKNPPPARKKRTPTASSGLKKPNSHFADQSTSTSLEIQPLGSRALGSDSVQIRRLATDRLNRVERRRLQTRIKRQFVRARMQVGDQKAEDLSASATPDSLRAGTWLLRKHPGGKKSNKGTTAHEGDPWLPRTAESSNQAREAIRSTINDPGKGRTLTLPNKGTIRTMDGLIRGRRRRRIRSFERKSLGGTEAAGT